MRVFLDVGSHCGETLDEVVKPKYGFDRIVCFEPASACAAALESYRAADPRIEICRFGLGSRTEKIALSNPGTVGASVVGNPDDPSEYVDIVDAAEWFRSNLEPSDFIVVKTNCEGAEVDIVNRLLDEGLFGWAVTFLITFDIRDYREHRYKEGEVRRRLKESGLSNYCFADDVMIGSTHLKRIEHWLALFGIDTGQDRSAVESKYAGNFRKYASKSGLGVRLEHAAKDRLGYSVLPEPIKAALRLFKRSLGMSRERDEHVVREH